MKKILLSSMLLVLSLSLWAVTATPYPFEVTLPNGQTMTVRLVGDEYHAYYTTLDGTPLRRLDNGYFVEDQTVKEQFPAIASARRNAAIRPRANATTFPLQGSPKSLVLLVDSKICHLLKKMRISMPCLISRAMHIIMQQVLAVTTL